MKVTRSSEGGWMTGPMAAVTRVDFDRFVKGKGLPEIRARLEAGNFFGEAKIAAMQWVAERDHEAERRDFEATLESARLSASAAARSARWTAWAAIAAAIGAIATAAGVLVQAYTAAPGRSVPSQVVAPTPAAPTVATSPP